MNLQNIKIKKINEVAKATDFSPIEDYIIGYNNADPMKIKAFKNFLVAKSEIIDNLTSTLTDQPLSANQGKELKSLITLLQGSLMPQGNWDANTNTPDISGTTTTGYFWIVSVDGNTDIGGITDWKVNDWVVKTNTGWAKIDNTDKIITINSQTPDNNGNVEIYAANINTLETGTIEENLSFLNEGKTGFNLNDPSSMPIITKSTENEIGISPNVSSFYFYIQGKKIIISSGTYVQAPTNITALYTVYYDNSGTLQISDVTFHDEISYYDNAIICHLYYNKDTGKGMVISDMHGYNMSAFTKISIHKTDGAKYESGFDIQGLISGGTTYTQITSGVFWSEDIRQAIANSTQNEYIYRLGTDGAWNFHGVKDNLLGIKNGGTYLVWNENTGTEWVLTEMDNAHDFGILFFVAMQDLEGNGVKKIIGQNAYPNKSSARDAVSTEQDRLEIEGLPAKEMKFLIACIVKRDGTLIANADGSLYIDLRKNNGSGGSSSIATFAEDVLTDTTSFNKILTSAETDVQKSLQKLNDNIYSGTYTPTKISSDGESSYDMRECQYIRIGNIVHVSGILVVQPSASGSYHITFSLPILSNVQSGDVNGTIGQTTDAGSNIQGRIDANGGARLSLLNVLNSKNYGFAFNFSYKIV